VDLDLDIAGVIGRKTVPLHAEVLRELTASDIGLLATERAIKPTHVQRITDRHHALARCLASGMSVTEACLVTGYTPSRISILRGDPSFEELIEFYRQDRGAEVQDLQQKFTALAKDATTEMQERLELDPASFNVDALIDIVKLAADRSGNGPQSKTTNVNVNVNLGDRMKAARERASQLLPAKQGPAEVGHGASPAPSPPEKWPASPIIEGDFVEVKK
jgi:hypothetical protein